MITYEEFSKKQDRIYLSKEDTTKVRQEGVRRGFKDIGAYLIAIRHPVEFTEELGNFIHGLSETVPILPYDSHNLHTTLNDFQITNLDDFHFHPDRLVLDNLAVGVASAIQTNRHYFSFKYSKWLYDQDTIFIAGHTDHLHHPEAFFDLAKEIRDVSLKDHGLELRLPWGAHITAARFTDSRTPEQLEDFFESMRTAPQIPESNPEHIDVGFFRLSDKGFNFTIYERLDI